MYHGERLKLPPLKPGIDWARIGALAGFGLFLLVCMVLLFNDAAHGAGVPCY
jgi:hypothetical protein